MEYHLLREDPPDTGVYVETGEVLADCADPLLEVARRTQTEGARYAIFPYEALNLR